MSKTAVVIMGMIASFSKFNHFAHPGQHGDKHETLLDLLRQRFAGTVFTVGIVKYPRTAELVMVNSGCQGKCQTQSAISETFSASMASMLSQSQRPVGSTLLLGEAPSSPMNTGASRIKSTQPDH